MKKSMIKMAVGAAALLLMASSAQAGYTIKKKVGDVDTKLTLFGFAQLEARGGDGIINPDSDQNIAFGAQRVRLGWKYVAGNVRGKVFLDFNQDTDDLNNKAGDGAVMPKYVKDAFVSYKFNNAFIPKLGLIKMPNGMSFTMPGWNLDIAERGFDKALVLERNMGLMISGRAIGGSGKVNGFEMGHDRPWTGFGYDIMIANQANRSAAAKSVPASDANSANSYAIRLMYDQTEKFHIEASYALSENADAAGGEDYSNFNIGIDSNLQKLSLKAEYFDAQHILGEDNWDETVYTATVGYFVTPAVEAVVKHIQGSSDKDGVSTDLGNTYLGVNLFLSMPKQDFSRMSKKARNQHKVVFNYVVASGDTDTWNGLKGYKDDAFILQYQFKF